MGQGVLVGLFSPVWGLCPFVPRDVLVLVFWWGWSQGEGFHTVEGDGVFPGPVDPWNRKVRMRISLLPTGARSLP